MLAPYSIEKLTQHHNRNLFSCGIAPLDDFLKTKANQQAKKGLGVTYVLLENKEPTIIGYYTLASTSISLSLLPNNIAKKLPRYPSVPAILLGRLAIDAGYQGKHLGAAVLFDALEKSLEYSENIGSMAIVVDAINDHAIAFYEKHGFISLEDCKNNLYLPMATVKELI